MAPEAAAVCAPYQKQATMARTSAGTLAPHMPKEARASTGKGTPVLTPAIADHAHQEKDYQRAQADGDAGN